MTVSILAVCAGNICRSPVAVAAIEREAKAAGLDVVVDSAGTGSWNTGEAPSDPAVRAGARVGLEVHGKARRVNPADFDRFDVIVAMDRSNLRDLRALAPNLEAMAKLRLFRTYDAGTDQEDEIPDPFGGTDADYDRAVAQIMASAVGLIASLAGMSSPVEDAVAPE